MQKRKATTRNYPRVFHKIKGIILLVFNFQCYVCGYKWHNLEVHHLDGDITNTDPFNLVCLCGSCHRKTHTVLKLSQLVLTKFQREVLEKTREFVKKYDY